MPRIAWYKKESNIVNMSSCIRQNNIVLFNREDVNKICLALNLSPKKVVDGKFVHADQIRTMYLRAYDYFKSHHIEKTSNNYASFMIWKYTKTKKDKTVHKEAIKSFEVITKNIYLCNKPRSMAIDADICSCSIEEKCKITSSCINRILFVECDSKCPVGELCENRCLQQNQFPSVEVFLLPNGHRGLRSSTVISKGQIIGEYCGEVIDQKQKDAREKKYDEDKEPCNYFFGFTRGLYIDSKDKGSITRYINHSCDGNSFCFNVNSEGELKVAVIANRIIQFGEEITFDYGTVFSGGKKLTCFCGSDICRGTI